jgi:murein DD-endopeptidase MepM/ murein hydrolase activator NlpD
MKAKTQTVMSLVAVLGTTLSGALTAPIGADQAPHDPAASFVLSEQQDEAESASSGGVMFIENVGQLGDGARFQVRGGNGTIWLAEDAVWVTVVEKPPSTGPLSPAFGEEDVSLPFHAGREDGDEGTPRKGVNLKLSFVGANPHPILEPFDRLDTHVSYFVGDDPEGWHADVPVWGGARYKGLYPGIDLEITGNNGQVVQRLVAGEGAALDAVRLRVEGADEIALDGDHLRLTTAVGECTLPLLQVSGPVRSPRQSPMLVGNEVATPFGDAQGEDTVPSPQSGASDLFYATFLGGSSSDVGSGIAIDGNGAAYVAGGTGSSDFPTTAGAFDTSFSSGDAFVVKLNADGSALAYATFLGGSSSDMASDITIDGSGEAYVTGVTGSSDFPATAGAFDTSFNGGWYHAFLVKLNPAGSLLAYATFLGGSSSDWGYSVATDTSGAAYVVGWTDSPDFPATEQAFDASLNGGHDGFVAKMNLTGSALVYATFVGGSRNDEAYGIATDATGSVYVVGETLSSDFPATAEAFDISYNGMFDAFAVRLSSDGSSLSYATFLGGNSDDIARSIATSATGAAYVTGSTASSDFPATAGTFDAILNGTDAFVVELDAAGAAVAYSTFLGGISGDYGYDIAVDTSGAAYVTGWTMSSDFPTTVGAFDTSFNGGDHDVFMARLDEEGSALSYGTFLGGSGPDEAAGIAVDASGAAYLTGSTYSSDFPTTPGAFDTSFNGGTYDAFVVKLAVPFLDLPLQYGDFSIAAQGSNGGGGPGYVNSWFDHTHPGYGSADGNLTTWLGPYLGGGNIGQTNCNEPPGGLGIRCYNGHDGIDFRHASDEVLAAANGTVFGIGFEPHGFGNYLYVDHHNCYASFYAHLKTILVTNGTLISDRTAQPLGIMGNTGLSAGVTGVHLHFGLYYDPDCDGDWSDKVVVDPYGWSGSGIDPWAGPSRYLWVHPYSSAQQSIDSSGGVASTPSGDLAVTVPAGAVTDPVTLELWDTPPVAGASAELRSTGDSFWMRVLEWLSGGASSSLVASDPAGSFDEPVTVTVKYDTSWIPHLDTSQLTIYRWDDAGGGWIGLPTTIDAESHQASAQTSLPGHFDLQAPLVCPADGLEPNDNYDGASVVQTDGSTVASLFDIAGDEDWFEFAAAAGAEYAIRTTDLAAGVDTVLEIYDADGVTLLASDDNGGDGPASALIWLAPSDGLYFVRVSQAPGSNHGCDGTYRLRLMGSWKLFLPLILR